MLDHQHLLSTLVVTWPQRKLSSKLLLVLCNTNQQMHTFQINVLIQFLASSTCCEHRVFIIRKTICTCSFVWYVLIYLCNQSSRWMDVLDTVSSVSAHLLDYLHKCIRTYHTKLHVQMVLLMMNT